MPETPAILNRITQANFVGDGAPLRAFTQPGGNYGFAGRSGPSVDHYQYNKQVHGKTIVRADRNRENATLEADGIWTRQTGLAIAVRTADCLPVLFSATDSTMVMAVHAGWRGLTAGILSEAIRIFYSEGIKSTDITAAIGPAISREKYEVGPEVIEALYNGSIDLTATAASLCVSKGREDRWHLDLQTAALINLIEKGIPPDQIDVLQVCTFQSERYFSFRREGKGVGSNISWIAL